MRLYAYHSAATASFIRRIAAPLDTLAHRGHHAGYQITRSLSEVTSTAHIVLLPNWMHDGALPTIAGSYIYDLSDARLLSLPGVQNVIRQVRGVLVPTEEIARRVHAYNPAVRVVSSMVHSDVILSLPRATPNAYFVGCFGPFDWAPFAPMLAEYLAACPQAVILTDDPSLAGLVSGSAPGSAPGSASGSTTHARVACIREPQLGASYLAHLRMCRLVLVPGEDRLTDPGPIFEAAFCGVRPVVAPAWRPEASRVDGRVCTTPQSWRDTLIALTQSGGAPGSATGSIDRKSVV